MKYHTPFGVLTNRFIVQRISETLYTTSAHNRRPYQNVSHILSATDTLLTQRHKALAVKHQ